MSRRRSQTYRSKAIEDLAHQLLYAPSDRRAEDIQRTEQLHDEIDPTRNYPLEFLTYRITDHRIPLESNTTLVGQAVQPDLRLLIDSLSKSIELPPSKTEDEESTAQLATRMSVSEKTIARWREDGLRWRWVTPVPGSRKRVAFPLSAVNFFFSTQSKRVQQAATFTRMTPAQRTKLLTRAKKMAQSAEVSLNQVAKHLARRTGRGLETIRQLLEHHDRDHPDDLIFADRTGTLTPTQRRAIVRSYRQGQSVTRICRKIDRTRSTVYRVINAQRAEAAIAFDLNFIASPMFDRDDADEVILRPLSDSPSRKRKPVADLAIAALPVSLRPYYAHPLPSHRIMHALMVRYNYLKSRAALARQPIETGPTRAGDLDHFESLMGQVKEAHAKALHAALPMVLSVCVRHQTGTAGKASKLLDLLTFGHAVLLPHLESFEIGLSARFESVLTNRLLRDLATARPRKAIENSERQTHRIIQWLADTGVTPNMV